MLLDALNNGKGTDHELYQPVAHVQDQVPKIAAKLHGGRSVLGHSRRKAGVRFQGETVMAAPAIPYGWNGSIIIAAQSAARGTGRNLYKNTTFVDSYGVDGQRY